MSAERLRHRVMESKRNRVLVGWLVVVVCVRVFLGLPPGRYPRPDTPRGGVNETQNNPPPLFSINPPGLQQSRLRFMPLPVLVCGDAD